MRNNFERRYPIGKEAYNIQDNQNENIFIERVTENNEFPYPEPVGDTTFNHTYNHNYSTKVLISDYYNYIVSIIKNEHRYMYVNERSIIENYTRWIMSTEVETNYITTQVFDNLKKQTNILDSEFALIKSAYANSCGYIHGSKLLNDNLAYVFKECITNDLEIRNINSYFANIVKVIKIYNRIIIMTYPNLIDECFFRRKSVLKYLLGDELLELLFKTLKNR